MINLLSKTGLGRSGHVRFQTFGSIWHVSGPKMVFWRNDIMILHHFCWRSSKIKLFWPKTLIFDQKFQKYLKNPKTFNVLNCPPSLEGPGLLALCGPSLLALALGPRCGQLLAPGTRPCTFQSLISHLESESKGILNMF